MVRVKVNLPLSAAAVEDDGSFAVSSPVFVVDLTETAGMLLFTTKLAATVTSYAGILMVVVAASLLPMNSTSLLGVQTFRPWLEGSVAVMTTRSPGTYRPSVAPVPLILPPVSLRR